MALPAWAPATTGQIRERAHARKVAKTNKRNVIVSLLIVKPSVVG
jgi:hypothetical protein